MSAAGIPSHLGRYEIQAELGRGSMGVVYLARDPLIGRLVALKVFRPNLGADRDDLDRFRSRFLREAQSAGILSHPNVVTVHDVVDEGERGTVFIAMEYVQGTNLKEVLRYGRPLELGQVLDIVRQVAAALDYAHGRGVVHRDVKPANVLLTPDRQVKLTDFGIAQFETTGLTHDGQLLGTPNYMSPEQVRGREVDFRTDLFSLGVVLYEMITRHKPFHGDNLTAVSHRIVYDDYTPPEEYTGSLPPGVSEIFGRALAKDPAARYPSAHALADDLGRAAESYEREVALSETQGLPPDLLAEEGRTGDAAAAAAAGDTVDTDVDAAPPPAAAVPAPPGRRTAHRGDAGDRAPAVLLPPTGWRTRLGLRLAAAGALLSRLGPEGRPTARRLAWVVGVTLVVALGLGWVLLRVADRADIGPVTDYGPEYRLRTEYLSLVRQGLRARQGGDPVAAAVAFRRAEVLAPDDPDIGRLRQEAEAAAHDLQADELRRSQLDLQVAAARAALAGARYEEALATAGVVLEVDPGNTEAAQVARLARVGIAHQARQRAAEAAGDQQAEAEAEEAEAAAADETPPAAADGPAYLAVALNTEGEGRVRVRVDDKLLADVGYDYVRRIGILRRKQVYRQVLELKSPPFELTAGTHRLYFWVTPAGEAARAAELTGDFQAGKTRRLQLYLSTDHQLSYNLE